MDVSIWTQRYLSENSVIQWNCPECNTKSLQIVKDKFISEETEKSKAYRKQNDDWEIEEIHLNISGQIECKQCKELIFFIGEGGPQETGYYDHNADDFISQYETSFLLKFVHPTIHIFDIPVKCPDGVKEFIVDSFKLYWTDLESCANKIRMSLEILMDQYKLKKYRIANNKRIPISLHKRIEGFVNTEVKDILLAIKWIGNTGSHSNTKLETIDILETYKLFEYALEKLYNNHDKEIKSIAKEINQRKGTRKRK